MLSLFHEKEKRQSLIADRVGKRPPGTSDHSWSLHCAETAAALTDKHYSFAIDAGKILCDSLYNNTESSFSSTILKHKSLYHQSVIDFVNEHFEILNNTIDHSRDECLSYFALKTLMNSYLLKNSETHEIVERPQHLWMRVSIGVHCPDLDAVLNMYDAMSNGRYIHATPTLFNSGTPKPQMSSCFLLAMKDDSIDGIFDTLKDCARISKNAGGIGLHIHNIRASGSPIVGTNGISNGLVPMLRVFNNTSRYVDQGGGRRKGSFAIYLEPWHADIQMFLQLRRNQGAEEQKARDLFYALWVPDVFMERVRDDGNWTLFCPNQTQGLSEIYGEKFKIIYEQYEREGKGIQTLRARTLWNQIIETQVETGSPYMLYKDACNEKSNQKNLGTIKSSNLCTEIIQYSSADETAVCNLASIALPKYVDTTTGRTFDFKSLRLDASALTKNLNRIIDKNYYPVKEARNSNLRHRPIGIGVQGLMDVYQQMEYPYESKEAFDLNEKIFETIYLGAIEASIDLASKKGSYDSYEGSPASKGQLQFDFWKNVHLNYPEEWERVKQNMSAHGLYNSLVTCVMPTVSTSTILGNSECIEPYQSNLFTRRTIAGQFTVLNTNLVKKLESLGLWNETIHQKLIAARGSVQKIQEIPDDVKRIYKTVWEIKQRAVIDQARGRAPFIDQSQSMSLHFAEPNRSKISAAQLYAWDCGLKTGVYYTRTQMKSVAQPLVETECQSCSA